MKKINLTYQVGRFIRSWISVPRLIPSRTSFTGMTTWVKRQENFFKELRGSSFLPRIEVRGKLQQESRKKIGFRVKPGMTIKIKGLLTKHTNLMNSKGISVIFLVIAMLLMVTIGYVFSYLIPTKQKSVVFPIQSTQAFFIAQSGVEFAIRYAQENGVGTLTGTTRALGTPVIGQFSLTYDGTGTGTLTSNGQVPTGTTRRSIQINNFTSFLAPISINYFASASTPPADPGTNTTNPTVVTPPGGLLAGDLVLMIAQSRTTLATTDNLTVTTNPGGQTWTPAAQVNQANCKLRLFWCTFNGTWTLPNPGVNFSGGANPHTVVMHVFRPSKTNVQWQVDAVQVSNIFGVPPAPRTVTILGGITTNTNGALVFATWASSDSNTWGNLTPGPPTWNTPGSAQYRNTSGADLSQTHAYRVMPIAGATGDVSKTETSAGAATPGAYDAGAWLIIAFKAILKC